MNEDDAYKLLNEAYGQFLDNKQLEYFPPMAAGGTIGYCSSVPLTCSSNSIPYTNGTAWTTTYSPNPIPVKLTSMMKKLLDPGLQTLYKAGYLNGDLELTEDGRKALNAILFLEKKDQLIAAAQERLDEEKECKK